MERPPWVTNEQEWATHCRKITARARDLLEGRLSVIDAAGALLELGLSIRALDDPDFITFTAIRSECTHLPVGAVRQYWAPDALRQKDVEIHAVEERWREDALAAARKLLEKYG